MKRWSHQAGKRHKEKRSGLWRTTPRATGSALKSDRVEIDEMALERIAGPLHYQTLAPVRQWHNARVSMDDLGWRDRRAWLRHDRQAAGRPGRLQHALMNQVRLWVARHEHFQSVRDERSVHLTGRMNSEGKWGQ